MGCDPEDRIVQVAFSSPFPQGLLPGGDGRAAEKVEFFISASKNT